MDFDSGVLWGALAWAGMIGFMIYLLVVFRSDRKRWILLGGPMAPGMLLSDPKVFQACYTEWLQRQPANEMTDPYRFAHEATERELDRRRAWPAIHAATMGFFAGVIVDVLMTWGDIELSSHPGHWVGSLPALIVGGLTYVALIFDRMIWHVRLDEHVQMAIEANEIRRSRK